MKYLWTLVLLIGCGKKDSPVVAEMIAVETFRACTSEQCVYCKDSGDPFTALEKCMILAQE